MRITLVISSLNGGGAERVMSILANYWAERGQDITLITHSAGHDAYDIAKRVQRVPLILQWNSAHLWDALRHNINRIQILRRTIQSSRPDIVISFVDTTNVLTLISCLGLSIPVIVSERTDPRQYKIGRSWSILRRYLYPRASAVVVQSASVNRWARTFLSSEAVHTIPNPVLPPPFNRKLEKPNTTNGKFIAAVGRLSTEKGHEILIKAASQVLKKHSEWTLIIIGEGPERKNLEKLADDLSLSDRICFKGYIKDPFSHLTQADLFVLPSRFEGFPNALLEAMSYGFPVISTDCPTGPAEIIRHEIDGLLVAPENVTALAEAMDRLMTNTSERERIARRAPDVITRFGLDRVMGLWDNLLEQVLE